MADQLKAIDPHTLSNVNGGMEAAARWIMQRESNGNPHAKNPHSSAFGAFQMLRGTRKQYMGANWNSHDINAQYAGASKYVHSRYGSWTRAKAFWQRHHWY